MTLKQIIEILEARIVSGPNAGETEILSVCASDLMSDLLHFSVRPKAILITGLINSQVVRTAEISEIKAVVFVLDKSPEREALELARQKDIPLLVTRLSRFTACGRLYSEGLRSCTGEDR